METKEIIDLVMGENSGTVVKKVELDEDFKNSLLRAQGKATILSGLADGLNLIDGDYLCRIPEGADPSPYNAASSLIMTLTREIKKLDEELQDLSDGIVR